MKIGMTYKDIIKHSPNGSEAKMWDAVDRVDCLIEKLKKEDPEMARDFLRGEYEAMNSKHISEWLAKEMIAKMWHKDIHGNITRGEVVPISEALRLLDGMDSEKKGELQWDAYVAANTFVHDLSNAQGYSKADIMEMARHFWFHDDDMGEMGCHKVYWYFRDWIFE